MTDAPMMDFSFFIRQTLPLVFPLLFSRVTKLS